MLSPTRSAAPGLLLRVPEIQATRALPNWPAFDTKQRATMILDNECEVVDDPNGEERQTLRAIQSR